MSKKNKNTSKVHVIKVDDSYIDNLLNGSKTCEVRFNDRDYQKGDIIKFTRSNSMIENIIDVMTYGKVDTRLDNILYEITHVLNYPKGLKSGYVVLSIKRIKGA